MSTLTFDVPGLPIAQPRAKTRVVRTRAGGAFAHIYTPGERIRPWKDQVRIAARTAAGFPKEPWTGPVSVSIEAYFPRPQRLLKRSSPPGRIWHTTKPDRDNLEKSVLDVLKQAGLYLDDAQVCAGEPRKYYVAIGAQPGIVVTASQLEAP